MTKVKKDNVIKEIDNEKLVADYLSAGWKKVEETKAKIKDSKEVKDILL